MKKNMFLLFIFLMIVETSTNALKCPLPGETAIILTSEDLQDMTKCIDTTGRTFVLENDIDLADRVLIRTMPVFKGTFNGNNKTIKNLKQGLFDSIVESAVIKNLILNTNISFAVGLGHGALANIQSESTLVSNVSVSGNIEIFGNLPTSNGGLIGKQNGGIIDSCNSSVSLILNGAHSEYNGGLVGMQAGGVIRNCHSSVSLTVKGDDAWFNGGLVGAQVDGVITNSSSFTSLTMQNLEPNYNGGLVGLQLRHGLISSSYANAKMQLGKSAMGNGGLVGAAIGTIKNTYASGKITSNTGHDNGGLVGYLVNGGNLSNSYSISTIDDGGHNNGGLVGIAKGDYSCTNSYWDARFTRITKSAACLSGKKTTKDMQQQATYKGWDFLTVWTIKQNHYPYLLKK